MWGRKRQRENERAKVGAVWVIGWILLISSPATSEEEGIPDVEVGDSDDDVINETLFTFEAFESVSQP